MRSKGKGGDYPPSHFADRVEHDEYGIWDTMYMHIRLLDLWRTRLLLKSTIAKIQGKPYTDNYRGFMRGLFWGSAQKYMDHAEGVYPYFYRHSGRGLDVLEDKQSTAP